MERVSTLSDHVVASKYTCVLKVTECCCTSTILTRKIVGILVFLWFVCCARGYRHCMFLVIEKRKKKNVPQEHNTLCSRHGVSRLPPIDRRTSRARCVVHCLDMYVCRECPVPVAIDRLGVFDLIVYTRGYECVLLCSCLSATAIRPIKLIRAYNERLFSGRPRCFCLFG